MTAANTPPITPAPAPLKVFISYAHEDDKHRIALGEQLAPLIRNGTFTVWHDRCLSGGQEWEGQIDQHLAESQIVLLLLSRHFLASDYCSDVEVKQALTMHHAGQARVVPVVLKHCTWQHSPLKILEALPLDGEPVVQSESERDAQDQRYLQVVEGLVRVARELHAPPNAPPVIPTTPPSTSQPSGWAHKLRRYWPLAVVVMIMVLGLGMLAAEKTRWQEQTRADLRVDRADLALARWQARPSWQVWLHHLLGLDDAHAIAELHNASRQANLDATQLKSQLTPLRDADPNNADLRFIEARRLWLHGYDGQTVQNALHEVLRADGDYAAADTLLGLLADRHGELAVAERHYAAALRKAPHIPDYLSNHARSLLELGQPDKARAEYAKAPPNYVLALVESALAAWAQGRPDWALEAQQAAQKWLNDAQAMAQHDNRHDWVFFYPSLQKSTPEIHAQTLSGSDKHCYVAIEHTLSTAWRDGQTVQLTPLPAACHAQATDNSSVLRNIQELVSADICRYIIQGEGAATEWIAQAHAARQQLKATQPCAPLLRQLIAQAT